MRYVLKRTNTNYVINTDENGLGGYHVVPKDIDPHNAYTIEQVEAYLAEHPEHLLDIEAIELERMKAEVRSRRDSLILSIRWRLERHQDELTLGLDPTELIEPILQYIQALRDVPQQEGFPEDIIWPEVP